MACSLNESFTAVHSASLHYEWSALQYLQENHYFVAEEFHLLPQAKSAA